MATCSNCATLLGDDKRKSQCGLCKEQRIPEPAIYCGKKCAQAHWKKEHKAWHEECAALIASDHAELRKRHEQAGLADLSKSEDKFVALLGRANKAVLQRDFREAVKQCRKAIAMKPEHPNGYDILAASFNNSGDATNAAKYFLQSMDLSKPGTEYHSIIGDSAWAVSTCRAYAALTLPSCTATRPAWFSDLRFVKHVASRAIDLHNNESELAVCLNVRAVALAGGNVAGLSESEEAALSSEDLRQSLRDYRRMHELTKTSLIDEHELIVKKLLMRKLATDMNAINAKKKPSADELRKALRDHRELMALETEVRDGPLPRQEAFAREVEAKLRAQVAADVAAAKSRAQAPSPPQAAPSRRSMSSQGSLDYSKWDNLTLSDSD